MSKYKLSYDEKSVYTTRETAIGNTVIVQIPVDEINSDYQEYLAWLDAGNIPDPADPPPPPDPQAAADKLDRDTFLSAVDGAIQAVNNQGWDGLPAATRKTIMLNVLRVVKVSAKRL
jgi:hypothetical protein